jgi:hypothetical protein
MSANLKIYQLDVVANSGIVIPQLINYNFIGLYKKPIQDKGLPIATEYYRSFDINNNTYDDLFVKEEYSYIEQNPLYLGVNTLVKWYDLDNNVGLEVQQATRMFNNSEIIDFGITRRSNVIANTKMYAFQQLGQNAFSLLDYCSIEISTYIQGNSPPLISKVNQSVGFVSGMTHQIADTINGILSNL